MSCDDGLAHLREMLAEKMEGQIVPGSLTVRRIREDCPHCKATIQEVLTTSPPRCPNCRGFLAPPLRMIGMDVKIDPSLPEGRIEMRDKDGRLRGAIVNIGGEEP